MNTFGSDLSAILSAREKEKSELAGGMPASVPIHRADAIKKVNEQMEHTEQTEQAEPVEQTEQTEPVEQTEQTEPVEQTEQKEKEK